MEDALVVGSYLNAFIRNAHIVKMANMAQLVNVIAPVFTSPEGLFYQTDEYRELVLKSQGRKLPQETMVVLPERVESEAVAPEDEKREEKPTIVENIGSWVDFFLGH